MKKHKICLIRGINVGGKNILKMDDLTKVMVDNGFSFVKTYIQSGNIIFDHPTSLNDDFLADTISSLIKDHFAIVCQSFVMDAEGLVSILDQNPMNSIKDCDQTKMYFGILDRDPEFELINAFKEYVIPPEYLFFGEKCIYFYAGQGYGHTKLTNKFIEKKLHVKSTFRNFNTLQKLCILTQ